MKKGSRPDNSIISERLDFGNPALKEFGNPSLEDVKRTKRKAKPDASGDAKANNDSSLAVETKQESSSANEKRLVVEKPAMNTESGVWSQNQQKILEWTLTQYPKGTTERWDRIAEHIPGKTKVRGTAGHSGRGPGTQKCDPAGEALRLDGRPKAMRRIAEHKTWKTLVLAQQAYFRGGFRTWQTEAQGT